MSNKVLTAVITLLIVVFPFSSAYADKGQDRALFSAVLKGNVGAAKQLIELGADVNAYNSDGVPLLRAAVDTENIEMVTVLLSAGAKVDASDTLGDQPIHGASLSGNTELAKALIEAGARVDARNKQGQEPLHDAVKSGSADLVKLLIAAGANVNARDIAGKAPLDDVNLKGVGDPAAVEKVLLAAGAKEESNRKNKVKPIWMFVAEPQLRLNVWDKLNAEQSFDAKYVVKCEDGTTLIAENKAVSIKTGAPEVIFPRDFHYAQKELESRRSNGCANGKNGTKLDWYIYADGVLVESGTMKFSVN